MSLVRLPYSEIIARLHAFDSYLVDYGLRRKGFGVAADQRVSVLTARNCPHDRLQRRTRR